MKNDVSFVQITHSPHELFIYSHFVNVEPSKRVKNAFIEHQDYSVFFDSIFFEKRFLTLTQIHLTHTHTHIYIYQNGNMHGNGTLVYPNGEKYTGDFVDGKRHGRGRYEYQNGGSYEGDWVNDKICGKGLSKYPNKNIYVGDFLVCSRSNTLSHFLSFFVHQLTAPSPRMARYMASVRSNIKTVTSMPVNG